MSEPQRIQRQRTKGWRMPEGAIYVGRPSQWGNPWPIDGEMQPWLAVALGERGDQPGRRASVVIAYRWWTTPDPRPPFPIATLTEGPGDIEYSSGATYHVKDMVAGLATMMLAKAPIAVPLRPDLAPLRGHDLACWCELNQPCHADVLLELANGLPS